jgi:hypothetical protein
VRHRAGGPCAGGWSDSRRCPSRHPCQRPEKPESSRHDESKPNELDPALDPFNPANGYNPKGASTYSDEFKRKYFKGQADRMNRLIARALAMQASMKPGHARCTQTMTRLSWRGGRGRA